ncbi:hypothetical protein LWI29_018884 [Acer saccharum]|uniref:Uncharacterized protein n=1 Tax=Acer saccharum TaxID=4024 RepID=A0AA39SM23_ACESA|nr:hypothetical protein LWI29_018884 [Acer saccharum]
MVSGMHYLLIWLPNLVGVYPQSLLRSLLLRLGKEFPLNTSSGLFKFAVCQVDQPAGDGLSVNSGLFFVTRVKAMGRPLSLHKLLEKERCHGRKEAKLTHSGNIAII